MKREGRRIGLVWPHSSEVRQPWANPLPDGSFRAVIQSKPIGAKLKRPPSIKREREVLPASLLPPPVIWLYHGSAQFLPIISPLQLWATPETSLLLENLVSFMFPLKRRCKMWLLILLKHIYSLRQSRFTGKAKNDQSALKIKYRNNLNAIFVAEP